MKNENQIITEKILATYEKKENTDLDELRALDKKVKRPVKLFSIIFGSLSAVIMGAGMSLIMTDIGSEIGIEQNMLFGLVFGIAGLLLSAINYPVYRRAMSARKKAFAPKIVALCDKINNN